MEYISDEGWEYSKHPNKHTVGENCDLVLSRFSADTEARDVFYKDTRPVHKEIFKDVTPAQCDYFAGNYRGAPFLYLQDYRVVIGEDEGTSPELVESQMLEFSDKVEGWLEQLNQRINTDSKLSRSQKLLYFLEFISTIFVRFLVIHPYANGNGHMARLMVWTFLQKKGQPLTFWSVDKRPIRPLVDCIIAFRRGDVMPLMKYFLVGITTGEIVTFESIGA